MKKLLSALLSLVLLAALCAPALSEETAEEAPVEMPVRPTAVLSWSDYEALVEEAGIKASFQPVGDTGAVIWMPDAFLPWDITLDDEPILAFAPSDQSAFIRITFMEADADYTIETMMQELADDGAPHARRYAINGLDGAFVPYFGEVDYLFVFLQPGLLLEVDFYPTSSEGFSALMQIIAASIQLAE